MRHLAWQVRGELLYFPMTDDHTPARSVLAHMNNRGMLDDYLSDKDRETALHLLGIYPDDQERAKEQRQVADTEVDETAFLDRILKQHPDLGKTEVVESA